MLEYEPTSSKYHVCEFSGKIDNIDFFGLNLPKNGFCDPNFKKLSPDLDSAPSSSSPGQFSVKVDSFKFLGLNLGKLRDTRDKKVQITLRLLLRAGSGGSNGVGGS